MTHTHMCKEDQDLFDFYSIPCYPSCMSTSVTRCWEKTDKQYNTNRILYNVDNDVLVQQGQFSPKYLQYTSHSLPEKDVWGIFCEIKGAFQKHLWALKSLHKVHIFQCMGEMFYVEFQRVPLKFHIKISYPYIERCNFIQCCSFKSS